jgi:hypothetical protein
MVSKSKSHPGAAKNESLIEKFAHQGIYGKYVMRDLIQIVEALDRALPIQWSDKSNEDLRLIHGEFQIGDGHFVVQFKMPYYDHIWNLSFVRNGDLKLSGTGNAAIVLATVMQAVREFIASVDPRYITFAADVTEPSRGRLYPRLIAMLASEFPEFTASEKAGRKHTTYDLERPARPWVAPPPPPKPEYEQVSPKDFEELMKWVDGGGLDRNNK